ncbi:MAG: hypothetical protein V1778_00240 [bacterium]
MAREQYATVVEEVRKKRDIPALFVLAACHEPEARIGVLRDFFLLACELHDDEAAERYLSFFLHAIDDHTVWPFLEKVDGTMFFKTPRDYPAQREAEERSCQRRADEMMGLFGRVSTHGTRYELDSHAIHVDGEGKIAVTFPVLTKTKKTMLAEVACRWVATKDPAEAERLFAWLLTLKWKIRADAALILSEAIKLATDKSASLPRLLQGLIAASRKPSGWSSPGYDEIGGILARACARNADWRMIARFAKALAPINPRSDGALEAVQTYAASVAELDESFRPILADLVFSGKTTIVYRPETHRITITVVGELDALKTALVWHATFEAWRDKIRTWCINSGYRVILTLRIPGFVAGGNTYKREEEIQ